MQSRAGSIKKVYDLTFKLQISNKQKTCLNYLEFHIRIKL
jgi:hypothetical protein